MRSLFVKIFLWFWSAHILIVSVLVLTTVGGPSGPNRENMQAMAGGMIAAFGEKAVVTIEGRGPAAAREQIDQLHRSTGIRLFLFDQDGEELLSQQVPSGAKDLACRAATSSHPQIGQLFSEAPMVAQRTDGHSARIYVALGQLPPGPLATMAGAPYLILLRLAAVVLMGGVVCYWLARYLTGPLGQLRTSVRDFANGNLAVRAGDVVGRRKDEMGDLGRDFNVMAERIESLVSAQRRLLTDVSHELRSPLARLGVVLGLVRQRTGAETQECLDRGEHELERLNELIGRLLELGRLESSVTVERQMRIDLAGLVREVVADAEFESGGQAGLVGILRCDECTAVGTPELLRGAIENIVRNAIRYTAKGTRADIALILEPRKDASQALIRVRDRGPGVPEEALQDIFRPFYRIGDDRNRRTGGAGLGLAIAQQAVRLHGGTISAANAPEGGLVVEVRLPACPGVPQPVPEAPV